MEVRKVVDDGLLLLGAIQDLRRRFCQNFCFLLFCLFPQPFLDYRALYCPSPSSPLLAIYGMIDGGEVSKLEECFFCKIPFFEVVGQSVLRLYRMEKGLPLVRSLMPEIPEVHSTILYSYHNFV